MLGFRGTQFLPDSPRGDVYKAVGTCLSHLQLKDCSLFCRPSIDCKLSTQGRKIPLQGAAGYMQPQTKPGEHSYFCLKEE